MSFQILRSLLPLMTGLAALVGCQQAALQPAGGGGGNDAASIISSIPNEAVNEADGPLADGLQASNTPGGVVSAPPSTENVNPCALNPEKCANRALRERISLGERCPKEALREVCWTRDFRKEAGLATLSDQEQFNAITQGRIPRELIAEATFTDICTDTKEEGLSVDPLFWKSFCVVTHPLKESDFLEHVSFEDSEDFEDALEGNTWVSYTVREEAPVLPMQLTEAEKASITHRAILPKPIK